MPFLRVKIKLTNFGITEINTCFPTKKGENIQNHTEILQTKLSYVTRVTLLNFAISKNKDSSMEMLMQIKRLFVVLVTFIAGYYAPILNFMLAMFILFLLNFFFGLTADIVTNGRKPQEKKKIAWENRKAIQFFHQIAIFFVIVAAMYVVGKLQDKVALSNQLTSWLCYATTWFFARNIVRNVLIILPRTSTMYDLFRFVYYVLSVQFLERVPLLKRYIETKKIEDEKH